MITVSSRVMERRAIFCLGGQYAVFDSHSRNTDGMISASGKSTVLYYSTLDDVCDLVCSWNFCKQAVSEMNPSEITGVVVI